MYRCAVDSETLKIACLARVTIRARDKETNGLVIPNRSPNLHSLPRAFDVVGLMAV